MAILRRSPRLYDAGGSSAYLSASGKSTLNLGLSANGGEYTLTYQKAKGKTSLNIGLLGSASIYSIYQSAVGRSRLSIGTRGAAEIYNPNFEKAKGRTTLNIALRGKARIKAVEAAPYFPDSQLVFQIDSRNQASKANFQEYEAKLFINNVRILVKSLTVSNDPRRIGETVNVELADINQRSLLTNNANIRLVISEFYDSAWHDDTEDLINTTQLESTQFNLAFSEKGFSFTATDGISAKINQSPKFDFTMFDQNRIELDEADFPAFYDNLGKRHGTSLFRVGSLSLYRILQEIVVRRCGMSGFKINVPDYLIARADFNSNQGYLDSLAGLLGMYRPIIFQRNNQIYIQSKARRLSSGLPPMRKLKADKYETLSISRNYQAIDGFTLNFTNNELEGSAYAIRQESKTLPADANGNVIRTETTYRDYYNPALPFAITDTKIQNQKTTTTCDRLMVESILNPGDGFEDDVITRTEYLAYSVVISEVTETNQYDRFGREISSSKEVKALLPSAQIQDGLDGTVYQVYDELKTFSVDLVKTKYAINPFKPSSQYIRERVTTKSGLVIIDSDNKHLGENFRQRLIEAMEAGNLRSSIINSQILTPANSITERFTIRANGQTDCMRIVTNDLGKTSQSFERNVQQGDASLRTRAQNVKMWLFPQGSDGTRTGKAMPDFFTGELPAYQAIELGKLELQREFAGKNRAFSVSIIGRDKTIQQGSSFQLYDHEDQFVANVIVVGSNLSITEEKTSTSLLVEEF